MLWPPPISRVRVGPASSHRPLLWLAPLPHHPHTSPPRSHSPSSSSTTNYQVGLWVMDVSPTENSWVLHPFNKASLGYCAPDRCVPTLDHAKHGTSSVGLRHPMDQWGVWPALPTPLTRFIGLAPLRQVHAGPTHRTPPLRSTKARDS